MKFLYAFSTLSAFEGMEIKKIEVKKETPKQYVVKNFYGFGGEDHINKSRMENGYRKYFETKELAIQGLKQHCLTHIQIHEQKIESSKKAIKNYQDILSMLEKKSENE